MVKRRKRSRRSGVRATDLQEGVAQLARAIEVIESLLQRAEQEVRAGARERIRQLRTEAREPLLALRGYEREAMQTLIHLSRAPKGSWGDLQQAADRALTEAHKTAHSIIERCRLMVAD